MLKTHVFLGIALGFGIYVYREQIQEIGGEIVRVSRDAIFEELNQLKDKIMNFEVISSVRMANVEVTSSVKLGNLTIENIYTLINNL